MLWIISYIAGPPSPSKLKIISVEGKELINELLPEKWDEVGEVTWARDGHSVLFTVGNELWQISAEGGQLRKLLTTPKLGYRRPSLCVHPDGQRIAFVASHGEGELSAGDG